MAKAATNDEEREKRLLVRASVVAGAILVLWSLSDRIMEVASWKINADRNHQVTDVDQEARLTVLEEKVVETRTKFSDAYREKELEEELKERELQRLRALERQLLESTR